MNKERNFLNISNWIFWIILGAILFMLLPYFKNGLYNDKFLETWVSKFDTISPRENPIDDSLKKVDPNIPKWKWQWRDFKNEYHNISFDIVENAYIIAEENRLKSSGNLGDIYARLYDSDRILLSDLIKNMKNEMKQKGYSYMQAIEYVCSSIQFIPYTLILPPGGECPCEKKFGSFSANCKVQANGLGCCPNVFPCGVYSPIEFVKNRTGDCDTRALLAYTLLKSMGFDVAVMVSQKEGHSVLGISLPNISSRGYAYGTNSYGKKYYLWELTNKEWRFGTNTVEGTDWIAELE